ncbi:AsnC family transcriptional regulator [Nocardia sp. CT2-14]|uniref:AsnC family transcriptional regulator n=1 Tax=Nocardia aurantiaca TaxID=2675850 RepID=A0A6I3KTV0_9NOCA|nr:AsnC family transcriptional regulator [Nocardia aurantiaca]
MESGTDNGLLPGSSISEPDLALIDALQSAPRAPWSHIGRAIGVDATTAARRWERLRADGSAWLTAYASARLATIGFVEIRCRPRFIDAVSAAAVELPWVIGVEETAGDFDLLISAGAADLPTLGRWVRDDIGGLRGIRSARMRVGITLFGEGGDWRMRALPPAQRAELSTPRASSRTAYGARGLTRLSPVDQALVTALHADARMSYTELGAAAGVSEHTARRRVDRLLREGDVVIRCDFAYSLAGLSTLVVYGMQVPQAQLASTGSALARLAQVRLCSAVSGRHSLMTHVLLHGLSGIGPFEKMLADRFPALEIKDRAVVLRTPKRVGWLLDERGRAVGRIPLGPLRP